MFKIAILISGSGTNMQAIIDNIKNKKVKAKIEFVIADRPCFGLERAKKENIKTFLVEKPNISSKIKEILKDKKIDLIILAGFLSILDEDFILSYKNKIINIHPSLLPKFGGAKMYGLNVHKAVIESHEKISGCTVHYVDTGIDTGKIIAQRKVEVKDSDTAEILQKRILKEEHILLSEVIEKIRRSEMKRALISVYNKEGIVEFSKFLIESNYEIISTGGTYKYLKENNIDVIKVEDITKSLEMLGGRVKTLHPNIHGGILARRDNEEDMKTLNERDIKPIDMVIVNLYPFFEKVNEDISFEEKIEFIDIGGPSMLRSAGKSFKDVIVISDPMDYDMIKREMQDNGVSYETRKKLASKVFNLTSSYDASISKFLGGADKYLNISYEKKMNLRYGENPHQKASYYVDTTKSGAMKDIIQLHGKELSFNNIRDMDIAWKIVNEFDEITCAALKHSTPCGVAIGETPYDAYINAYNSDNISIFGGIVAFNSIVDEKTASEMIKIFLEIIIAPDFTEDALRILKTKKNLRIIKCNTKPMDNVNIVKVDGGILIQDEDRINSNNYEIKSKVKPSEKDLEDMKFGMKIVKYVKSNGIVVVKDKRTLGFGNGETNRIWAANQAIERAQENVKGAILASDAFFPFGDVAESCHNAGIKGIVEPGGSIRDNETIDVCNEFGIELVFTGIRHFKH